MVLTPKLDPDSVTLIVPVPPTFVFRVTLIVAVATLRPLLTLPTRRPNVIAVRRLPAVPSATRQLTDVSDAHDDLSHAVCPCPTDPLIPAHPSPAPCSVTLIPPVAATFARSTTLPALTSVDCPSVMLPTRLPAVSRLRPLPITLCPTSTRTDVSESHPVSSHPVSPSLPPLVWAASPMLAPCKVTLADPVAALFACRSTLSLLISIDMLPLTLAIFTPLVRATRLLLFTPDGPWQTTDVSDTHAVCSQAVAPALKRALCAWRPRPPPITVTLVEPLAPTLLRRSTLVAPALVESALDVLPALSPTVASTFRLPIKPPAA